MNTNRLAEIRERLSKATPGPWVYDKDRDTHDCCIHTVGAVEKFGYISNPQECIVGSSEWIWITDADGEFIAHAWADIAYLLAKVADLQAQLGIEAA